MATTHCKKCGNKFTGKFCNAYGAKVYAEKDKSLSNILHEALHFFTHLDNKFSKTISVIFSHPDLLSITYCNGIRSRFYKPFFSFLHRRTSVERNLIFNPALPNHLCFL